MFNMHFRGEQLIHWCILIFFFNYSRSIYKHESEFNINYLLKYLANCSNYRKIMHVYHQDCIKVDFNLILQLLIYLYLFLSYCCLWLEQTRAAFSDIRHVILPILMWLSCACERIEYLVNTEWIWRLTPVFFALLFRKRSSGGCHTRVLFTRHK